MEDLLNEAPCGFASFTDDSTLTAVNETLADMLGYAPHELVGRKFEVVLSVASRIFFQTHFFPLVKLHGSADEIFMSLRTKESEDIPVLVNAVRRVREGVPTTLCVMLPVPHRRKYEDEILEAKRAAQEALRSNAELTDAKRQTERHARDLDRQLTRLRHMNDELTRVGTVLAHELREPMRKISMFSDILKQESADALTRAGHLAVERIHASSGKTLLLLSALQQFLSLDSAAPELKMVDLDDVVDEVRKAVAGEAGLDPETITRESLPRVQGYRSQLTTLFFHLLDNAVRFRKPDLSPQIHIACDVIRQNDLRATEGRYRYIDYARIVVSDQGIGFANRYREHVVDLFKKLDPESPGLGLGLAVSRKIAHNHHGSLEIESEPGVGTRVTVLLPLEQQHENDASPA